MSTVLHITAASTQWWQKSSVGWVVGTGPGKGPIWVLTDLTEESVAEITVPRVFGTDRSHFVERQLATRYPETEFRAALAPRRAGSLMDRLAPPLQTLMGVEPADKVKVALQGLTAPVAGVWCVSMLLTQLGRRSSLPGNLFVVHCQAGAMRILYLKERAPVLTRLVSVAQNVNDQAAEMVRTLRHLENTRVIDRGGQRFGILLLGGNEELATALAKDRLDVLPLPAAWAALTDAQSDSALFDMVCKSPPGQLAPIRYRASYLANNLTRVAQLLAAGSLLLALWLCGDSIQASLHAQRDRQQVETALADLATRIEQVDKSIESFGVSPDMVRNALAIDEREISSAPSLQTDLKRLSKVISAAPSVRIKQLQWQVLELNAKPCSEGAVAAEPADPAAAATTANPDASAIEAAHPARMVELQMSLQLPPDMGPRQATQHAESITRALAGLKGAKVMRDPARTLRDGDIRVGGLAVEGRDMQWCVGLATPVAVANAPDGGKQ